MSKDNQYRKENTRQAILLEIDSFGQIYVNKHSTGHCFLRIRINSMVFDDDIKEAGESDEYLMYKRVES